MHDLNDPRSQPTLLRHSLSRLQARLTRTLCIVSFKAGSKAKEMTARPLMCTG